MLCGNVPIADHCTGRVRAGRYYTHKRRPCDTIEAIFEVNLERFKRYVFMIAILAATKEYRKIDFYSIDPMDPIINGLPEREIVFNLRS